jgi:H+/Cl- antiporter ClcA
MERAQGSAEKEGASPSSLRLFDRNRMVPPTLRWLGQWVGVVMFLVMIPPLIVFLADAVLLLFIDAKHRSAPEVDKFSNDLPTLIFAYLGGLIGSIISYVYDRNNAKIDRQDIKYVMARFLLGGFIGGISFLLVKSTLVLKLLYPKLDTATFSSINWCHISQLLWLPSWRGC